MRKVWLVGSFALREALRRRIVQVMLAVALLLLLLFGWQLRMAWQEAIAEGSLIFTQTVALSGARILLFVLNLLTSVAAIFVASGSLGGEVESGSLHVLLPRTITRAQVYMGKLLAVTALAGGFGLTVVAGVGVMFALSDAGWPAGFHWVLLLFPVAPVVLGAGVLALGSRLGATATGLLALGAYVLAQVGSMLESVGAISGSAASGQVGIIISLLTPVDAVYRFMMEQWAQSMGPLAAGFLAMDAMGAPAPSAWTMAWAAFWFLVVTFLGMHSFRTRDL